jgi:hypothetical protein
MIFLLRKDIGDNIGKSISKSKVSREKFRKKKTISRFFNGKDVGKTFKKS